MMGAAMLKRHQFVQSLWALYRLVVSSIMWGSQAQPLLDDIKIELSLSKMAASIGTWSFSLQATKLCVSHLAENKTVVKSIVKSVKGIFAHI